MLLEQFCANVQFEIKKGDLLYLERTNMMRPVALFAHFCLNKTWLQNCFPVIYLKGRKLDAFLAFAQPFRWGRLVQRLFKGFCRQLVNWGGAGVI